MVDLGAKSLMFIPLALSPLLGPHLECTAFLPSLLPSFLLSSWLTIIALDNLAVEAAVYVVL